jgi:thiamine-phosphate pyrophosphorylase
MLWSDHVLLALLREQQPLREEMESHGLSFAKLQEEVQPEQGPPLDLQEPLKLVEAAEEIDTVRILDAEANRAREALRVVEDYCRFVLDDAFLSRQWKQMRHDLTAALSELQPGHLLEARDTLRDVGTDISTSRELHRHSLLGVVQANCKRLQEALRSLEEFGKLRGPKLGFALEQLRYRTYTLERATGLGATARQRLADVRLYVLVSVPSCAAAIDWTIQEAAAGGATMFQLREKNLSERDLLERGRRARKATREAGAILIMNDRPDMARLVDADGVHLGQDDMPVKEARRIVGPNALIGVSTHNIEQVRQAILDGASYIGVGPTFTSETKTFKQLAGLDFVRQVGEETTIPAFVIGGINLDTIGATVEAGAKRVAVSHAICNADDPRKAAVEMLERLSRVKDSRPERASERET